MTGDVATPVRPANPDRLVEVSDLKKHFPIRRGILIQRQIGAVRAVDGVSFFINRGETLGLVGESGCGKTTVGRTMLGLYPATEGQVEIDGHDVVNAMGKDWQPIRRKAQMISQDPFASLNPRWTVNAIVGEPLRVHGLVSGKKEQAERELFFRSLGVDHIKIYTDRSYIDPIMRFFRLREKRL